MRRVAFSVWVGALGMLAAATPVGAHHSFAAEFDGSKPITITGVVTEMRWENPHTWFYLNVPDGKGGSVRWSFEGGTPTSLYRHGIKPSFLKVGDTVTVNAFHARDPNANVGAIHEFVFADGRKVMVGPSDGSFYPATEADKK